MLAVENEEVTSIKQSDLLENKLLLQTTYKSLWGNC